MSESLIPRFPIALYGDEWNEWSYDDELSLATATEFLDDSDPPYRAVDAEGYPVRLIVWNVELLVCHRIFVTTSDAKAELHVLRWTVADESIVIAEFHDGTPVRAVRQTGDRMTALPRRWNEPVEGSLPDSAMRTNEIRAFHAAWMRARAGRRRWP